MRANAHRKKMRWFNKKVVEENTFALKIDLHCWPMVVFAISIGLAQFIISGIMLYLTATLYDEGFRSNQFRKGGGMIMMAFGATGAVVGLALSFSLGYHLARVFMLSASLMTLFLSIPLAGFRGGVAGSLGGVPAGIAIGTSISENIGGLLSGAAVGLLCGILLGGAPIFWKLDSVDRYLNENYHLTTYLCTLISICSISETTNLLSTDGDECDIE
ncbi:conserved hypothetical protein [Theileria orientalis strain Shintoku]|uniref:Uncharacterized protein n=1 Tax=Theileria orientalis strain Shintoku TaxID=869250 RepID=J4CCI9_THEOR|nr:conserved hypothetical protein [Theileria orientalis strain Shintoku]BAM39472.1 conserved hypothetical protein [Theileria orientalis strain Shintoku]|eukprot:XP_009689773.1 conserved hypothetical protein [Theileria orientalis strain Shintoku]